MNVKFCDFTEINNCSFGYVAASSEVEGLEGSSVQLPCELFPADLQDKINLILWYRDDHKDPMYRLVLHYSFDIVFFFFLFVLVFFCSPNMQNNKTALSSHMLSLPYYTRRIL